VNLSRRFFLGAALGLPFALRAVKLTPLLLAEEERPYSIPMFIDERDPPSAIADFALFVEGTSPAYVTSPLDILNEARENTYLIGKLLKRT